MKDAGMRIRVEPELRERFISLCHEHNVPAAQVLRSFMREYVMANANEFQNSGKEQIKNLKRKPKKMKTLSVNDFTEIKEEMLSR